MDPRLQSVHLPGPRRQSFRQARAEVLYARGNETVAQEGQVPAVRIDNDRPVNSLANTTSVAIPCRLALVEGDRVYSLHIGLNTLGRASENDVVLREHHISRRHCTIVVHASLACEIFDMASRNGTYLNDHILTASHPLRHRDRIRICDRSLVFVVGEAPSGSLDPDTIRLS